ncbi:NAD(P)/FAD-dependent oxidoreductase [Spongiactinospora sp. TRM90649]|uniref:NAD(P)/FAD-dependent oxidoreductase n=1 Tax=Spongiactinospora sp. TRM90649 TaxID=3031114 RepID=UPI0023F9EF8A|nr:NAD(P)/FAD-dependent oxidoreductase [Spongiactinospora sp. TRM90649]MDF5755085.1 NAD(P)/FAD-dependent oxidoreductase [Spongiactinospora sp. TRM90649]
MSATRTIDTDVVIVGAGPTGLYGAYYAGFRGLSTVVVDVLPQPGGQVTALYPEKEIRDVAAIPAIRGRDFVAALVAQAAAFDPTYVLGRQAVNLTHSDGEPVLTLSDGTVVRARAVVLTAGIGTPTPRPLPCGEEWLGRGLSYFVVDPRVHAGRDVVIVGGGDSALDWADALSGSARSVTLVHRRAVFRGHAATLARVRAGAVDVHTDSEIVALHGEREAGRLAKVTVRARSGDETVLPADHVIAALGFISDLGPLRDWGLELAGRSVAVDRRMRTNLPRVYAAGDLTDYDGKVRLMSVGFGEVATAMNHVAVDLDPDLTLFPGHSTDGA